jgi:dihydroflavonol-4-reductase
MGRRTVSRGACWLTPEPPAFLVTGGSGFLGRHVLLALRRLIPQARLVVLLRDRRTWDAQPWTAELGAVEHIEGTLGATEEWRKDPLLAGTGGIVHLAAVVNHSRAESEQTFRVNVDGTAAMVELAAELHCRVCFVSSSGVVSCSPRPGQGALEDGEFREDIVGAWPYYASKIAAERKARTLASSLGVTLVVLRPPVLLGPGDHRFRSTAHVLRVLQRRLPAVPPGGMHFADVRDVADAVARAARLSDPRPVYHLVGTASSLDEFFRKVADVAGIEPSWRVLPARWMRLAARLNARLGSPVRALPDPVLVEMASHYWDHRSCFAEADLGYRSRPPAVTLRDTVEWLLEHHPELRSNQPGGQR